MKSIIYCIIASVTITVGLTALEPYPTKHITKKGVSTQSFPTTTIKEC